MTNIIETDTVLSGIRLLLMDVDGVLTDGRIVYTGTDSQTLSFHVTDGLGLRMLHSGGILTGVVTGRRSAALARRIKELGISLCYEGVSEKGGLLPGILQAARCDAGETAYIGDDLPDIPIMRQVGLPIAVMDARPEVQACATIVTQAAGGKGAVREICESILKANGKWPDIIAKWVS